MDSLDVTVKNGASVDLIIDGDPNWDDQVITIDGAPENSSFVLPPGASAVVGLAADYNEMGVIFATSKNYDYDGSGFYQLTISPDDSGNLAITDGGPQGVPTVDYTLSDQQPLSMTMDFVDAA